ncbi:MAG: type II toxin-antitoxin system VapC family toxin [Verrucomicrobiota bacterium]|nr:type II toxin-antitoxin system VapC family toxin [Verrucomicrobiota bacterium]
MSGFYLDSDTCIDFLRGNNRGLYDKIQDLDHGSLLIPSMVKAELIYGAYCSHRQNENRKILDVFLGEFKTVDFDSSAAEYYAKIKIELKKSGQPIGGNDMVIASTVLSRNGTLITRNHAEFSRIEGLRWEDWSQ